MDSCFDMHAEERIRREGSCVLLVFQLAAVLKVVQIAEGLLAVG